MALCVVALMLEMMTGLWLLIFLSIPPDRREYGLERFVPTSLVEAMKRKELRKLLSHFVKVNQQLTAPGQKQLTALQAKLHYLKIIGELPSYGAKCFSTTLSVSWLGSPTKCPFLLNFYSRIPWLKL